MGVTATAMDTMARGKPRLLLLLSLAMAMADMVDMATAMVMDMAGMDTMATMARGRLRQLLWLMPSQKLLLSLVTDTMADTAMVATEAMAIADMVTTAIMARGLLMLMPTMATEDTVDMVTAMATTARDLPMPTTATEDTVDMVMATATATVMDTDTMDKKKEVMMMSR